MPNENHAKLRKRSRDQPPDANGQAIAYIYLRENEAEARQAKTLTADEARRFGRQFRM